MVPQQRPRRSTSRNEPLELLWDALKPAAQNLLNIMSSGSSTPPPARLLAMSAARRSAVCTHTTMTRIYGTYKCNMCNQSPNIGWVYVCTQDNCNRLPSLDGTSDGIDALSGHLDNVTITGVQNLDNTTGLSSWVARDIEQGLYTSEQIEILKAQKLKVKEVITLHESSLNSKDRPVEPQVTMTPVPTDSAAQTESPSINSTSTTDQQAKTWSSTRSSFIPPCTYKTCHRCRPTYRERCYDNLAAVAAGEVRQYSEWHLSYRPTSDMNVVKKLGLRKQRPPLRRLSNRRGIVYDTASEDSDFGTNELRRSFDLATPVEGDEEDEEQSKGFRAIVKTNMKKAFKGLMANRRISQAESESSGSGISINSDIGRRLPVLDEGVDEDAEEFDISLWRERNDEILRDAARVSLPDAEQGDDEDFGDGEVEVEGGVAVTEEAVEMHAADIMLQV
ncbi:MAG: hypothetical protein M1812_004075 [Candelaria pacifica]|nr:MAG: hypothetical protein M1812_004075 [Candelaria pacifica]